MTAILDLIWNNVEIKFESATCLTVQLCEEVVEGLLESLHVFHVQPVVLAGRRRHLLADPFLHLLALLHEPGVTDCVLV